MQAIFDAQETAQLYVEYEYSQNGGMYYGDFTIHLDSNTANLISAQLSGVDTSVTSVANRIELNFTEKSLYTTDYDYLRRGLTFSYVDDSGNTQVIDNAIWTIQNIQDDKVEILLDHQSFPSGSVSKEISVEYDRSSYGLQSVDGQFADSFTSTFTYAPLAGPQRAEYAQNNNGDLLSGGSQFTLTLSGGQLDTSLFTAADYDSISQEFFVRKEDGSDETIVGAISGISSINDTTIDFVFSVDALQQANVTDSSYLTINHNGNSSLLKNIQSVGGSSLDVFSMGFNAIIPPVVDESSHDAVASTLSIDFSDAHDSYLDTSSFIIADDSASLISSFEVSNTSDFSVLLNNVITSVAQFEESSISFVIDPSELTSSGVANDDQLFVRYVEGGYELVSESGANILEFTTTFSADLSNQDPQFSNVDSTGEILLVEFSGGNIDIPNNSYASLQDYFQISTDENFVNIIDNAVSELTADDHSIQIKLNSVAIQSAAVSNNDNLFIKFVGGADLIQAAGTLNDIENIFSSNFAVNLDHVPNFASSGYSGSEFLLNFSDAPLDSSDLSDAKYAQILQSLEVSSTPDFSSVISGAIDSLQDLNTNSIQINFDLAQLQTSGVSHNDTLYIRYLGGEGLLQGQSTDVASVPLGSFSSSFNINLDEIKTKLTADLD